ncbi:hypothetical protein KIK84_06920 [Curvibacter sp. CHRR-16]|uniref:hypothetical protein n=1 Tax=Curvibacter sp. CHRR-16 TaxID=2835872 RepID=UPI001BD941FD|nr:hypothetical protein [Curvibacter sp. CHRR-16]MBT0570049.1 hypothetical protein [Curvibacter sp. CHRR-16]
MSAALAIQFQSLAISYSSLGHLAAQHKAQDDGDSKDQGQVAKALQAQNEAIKGTQGKDSTNNSKHPELSEPHLVLASPAGIESTSTAMSTMPSPLVAM